MRFARLVCTTAALVLAVTPVWAQTGDVPADAARSVGAELTVSDIVWMAEEGVSEDIIRAKVRESGQVFYLSVDEILRLKKAGVPDAVVVSMLESGIQTRVYKAVSEAREIEASRPVVIAPSWNGWYNSYWGWRGWWSPYSYRTHHYSRPYPSWGHHSPGHHSSGHHPGTPSAPARPRSGGSFGRGGRR